MLLCTGLIYYYAFSFVLTHLFNVWLLWYFLFERFAVQLPLFMAALTELTWCSRREDVQGRKVAFETAAAVGMLVLFLFIGGSVNEVP
jgi:hypothetical protein